MFRQSMPPGCSISHLQTAPGSEPQQSNELSWDEAKRLCTMIMRHHGRSETPETSAAVDSLLTRCLSSEQRITAARGKGKASDETEESARFWRVTVPKGFLHMWSTDLACCLVDKKSGEAIFDIMPWLREEIVVENTYVEELLHTVIGYALDQGATRMTTFLSSKDHFSLYNLRDLYAGYRFSKGSEPHTINAWGLDETVQCWTKTLVPSHNPDEPQLDREEVLWKIGAVSKVPFTPRPTDRRGHPWVPAQ